ncbi:MAG: carboxypeptidase-like regulatory domain-containing protein, partial [Candidatus Poribacteria bacterium]|nr:carboxypeptidase-like regulatory domain-containing protein [Candidatus Poribacteria bacterium]
MVCLFCYLKDSQSASNTTRSLEGEVAETQSSTRLDGVTVRIKGFEKRVRTDANGRFKFDAVPEGQQTLQFLKVGYQQFEQVVNVNTSTPYLKIELKALSFQLQTIRVYGSNRSLS